MSLVDAIEREMREKKIGYQEKKVAKIILVIKYTDFLLVKSQGEEVGVCLFDASDDSSG